MSNPEDPILIGISTPGAPTTPSPVNSGNPVPVTLTSGIAASKGTPTATGVIVTTSNGQILAANANRNYLLIQNQDPSNPVYLSFGGTAVADKTCLKVPAGALYVAENGFIPTSAVSAIATGASVNVHVEEA